MRLFPAAMSFLILTFFCLPVRSQQTQQKSFDPPRAVSSSGFDAASIKRQAAQLAEFRTLLADPDPNVRVLTMREAFHTGDAVQRQMAIEAGLVSSESSMVEMALRGLLTNVHQIIIEFVDDAGKPIGEGEHIAIRLTVTQYEAETGRIEGTSFCPYNPKWSGQLQGTVFTFTSESNVCSGNLSWMPETGDFRGHLYDAGGPVNRSPHGIWKPR